MLVNSIGYINKNNAVSGVDTSKVQAKPVMAQISKDFKYNSFTNNPQPETVQNPEEKSVIGKFLNIFA